MASESRAIVCLLCHAEYDTPLATADATAARCRRCYARLHWRKPDSLNRAWAYLVAAVAMYIPANLYPIMTIRQFGHVTADTIISGVIRLLESGMWPLAALVFFASVIIPILKIIAMVVLLFAARRPLGFMRPREQTRLFRAIESVGRWSMVDIFMVSILIALVRLGNFIVIEPGIGTLAFAAVVIFTMLSAQAFDPRLIWDQTSGDTRGR